MHPRVLTGDARYCVSPKPPTHSKKSRSERVGKGGPFPTPHPPRSAPRTQRTGFRIQNRARENDWRSATQ